MAVTVQTNLGSGQPTQESVPHDQILNAETDAASTQPRAPDQSAPESRQNSPFTVRPPILDVVPKLTVIGVGGAGGNAVNNMIKYDLQGVKFVATNTDAQALQYNHAPHRVQLGLSTTHGLGAGSRPNVGRSAAEESIDEIMELIGDSNMVFITAGMGGGTGTGAAPVIAEAARKRGILTVGVVTKPFQFEGAHRMRIADAGIEELQAFVDTLLIIPNQNLFRVANEQTTFADAFKMADDVLYSGVRSVTDLMIIPGLINLDFADIKAVMTEMGKAMMGTGEARGENRAVLAAEAAIANPLLDDVSMRGAKGVLISVTGGMDMTLFDVDAAANRVRDEVEAEHANIIFGSTFDPAMEGMVRVSVVATGIDQESISSYDSGSIFQVLHKPESHMLPMDLPVAAVVLQGASDTTGISDESLDFEAFSHEEETLLATQEHDSPHNARSEEDDDEFLLAEEVKSDLYGSGEQERGFLRPRPEKRSLLSRLFGRREAGYEESSQLTVRSSSGEETEADANVSDVPAYMRRPR